MTTKIAFTIMISNLFEIEFLNLCNQFVDVFSKNESKLVYQLRLTAFFLLSRSISMNIFYACSFTWLFHCIPAVVCYMCVDLC